MRKIFKFFFYLPFLPLIFVLRILKHFFKLNYVEIDTSRLGHTSQIVEGFLCYNKQFYKNKKSFIFLFNNFTANRQINNLIERKLKVYKSNIFLNFLKKSTIYWNQNDLFYDISYYSLQYIFNKPNNIIKKKYDGPRLVFTKSEIEKGQSMLKEFGINPEDKWCCVHNRDSLYLKKQFPTKNFDYHNYRDFSVEDLKPAAKFFSQRGYFVFRVGKFQKEKFITNDSKIIDYSFSEQRNDFLDIYLLAFSEFFLGSSSGPMNVSFGFNRPSYGVNYSLPYFSRSHIPYMFTFKRIQNNRTGKLLSLREILQSNFCDKIQNNLLLKYNHS